MTKQGTEFEISGDAAHASVSRQPEYYRKEVDRFLGNAEAERKH